MPRSARQPGISVSMAVQAVGYTMHAEFVPMSQCRHLAIVARVDSLCAIRTRSLRASQESIGNSLIVKSIGNSLVIN